MNNTILTIMLPTTIDRRHTFYPLLHEITRQINELNAAHDYIEILIDEDYKQKSIGIKRQHLLEKATGTWSVGIDSDDMIAPSYLTDILQALNANTDVDHVGFIENCIIDGVESKSIFSIRHKDWDEKEFGYDQVRCANPKSVIRTSKALQVGYIDCRFGEDRLFSEAVTPILNSEVFIDKPLYFYKHNSTNHNERYGIK